MGKKLAINDQVVLKLQEQIKIKEQELLKISKPSWKTNNNLEVYGVRYNLHVQSIESLSLLFSYLIGIFRNLNEAYELLQISSASLKYNEYTYAEWYHDISLHIAIKDKRIKEQQLNKLKERVASLLSDELKAKIELDAINEELKNI